MNDEHCKKVTSLFCSNEYPIFTMIWYPSICWSQFGWFQIFLWIFHWIRVEHWKKSTVDCLHCGWMELANEVAIFRRKSGTAGNFNDLVSVYLEKMLVNKSACIHHVHSSEWMQPSEGRLQQIQCSHQTWSDSAELHSPSRHPENTKKTRRRARSSQLIWQVAALGTISTVT